LKMRRIRIPRLSILAVMLIACAIFLTGLKLNAAIGSQATATPPLRIGNQARELSKEEITALEMLLPETRTPWLLMDDVDAAWMPATAAFLPPESQSPELRRGKVITLRRFPYWSPDPSLWAIIEADGIYAQVAVAGRSFDEVQTIEDTNRPFRVSGTFDDAELLNIVHFLRTKYRRIPLRSIERDGSGYVLVTLVSEPVVLVLGKEGQIWRVLVREPIELPNRREPVSALDRFSPPPAILNHVESPPQ